MIGGQSGNEKKESEFGDLTTENYSRGIKSSLYMYEQTNRMIRCPNLPSGKAIRTKFVMKPTTNPNSRPSFLTYSLQRKQDREAQMKAKLDHHIGDDTPAVIQSHQSSQTEFSELMDQIVSPQMIEWDLSTPWNNNLKAFTPGGFGNRADKLLKRVESTQLSEQQLGVAGVQQRYLTPINKQPVGLGDTSVKGSFSYAVLNGRSASLQVEGGCTPVSIRASMGVKLRFQKQDISELPMETPLNSNSKPSSSWIPGTKTNKSSGWKLDTIPDLDKILASQPAFTRFMKQCSAQLSQT